VDLQRTVAVPGESHFLAALTPHDCAGQLPGLAASCVPAVPLSALLPEANPI
jgi:hypothetical protein